jgi:hypothetical protein
MSAARERGKVSREESDATNAAFDGITSTVEDNGLARLNPLLDFAWRECDEVGDGGRKDI